MELRQLRYFVAVAEVEHFNHAAEHLHVAQSALSRHVKELERELGVDLFERLPRGVRLTPAGHALADRARRILDEVEAAYALARETQQGRVGLLRLGFNAIAVKNGVVPTALHRFRLDRPGVHLSFNTLTSPEQLSLLYADHLDVGFLYTEPGSHPELNFVEIVSYRMVVAMRRDHPLAVQPVLRISDLRDQPFVWITEERHCWITDRLSAECGAHGFTPRVVQGADDAEAQMSLVAVGLGIAFVHPTQQQSAGSDLLYKEVADLSLVWPLYLCWRRSDDRPVVLGFAQTVQDLLGSGVTASSGRAPTAESPGRP